MSTHLKPLRTLKVVGCGTDLESLLPALEANPFLETFIMHSRFQYKWHSTSPLYLPHLTHIELGGSWASSLLEVITMPTLQVLHISGASGSLDRVLADAADKSTNLKQLTIDHCSVTPTVLVNFIHHTPYLTALELRSLSRGANHVVEALAAPLPVPQARSIPRSLSPEGEVDILCPSLTHLNLSHSPDLKTGSLVRLVKSRLRVAPNNDESDTQPIPLPCSELVSLVIDGCDQVDVDWVPWFRKNVQFISCVYQTKKKATWKR